MLPSAVALLPTPAVNAQDWGIYEPAVRRWEQVTRPAPPPAEPNWLAWWRARARRALSTAPIGHRGSVAPLLMPPSRRLSPQFSEWMMGLPEGHVTGRAIGLTRVQQLRALGNGVVPAQCALATRLWLAWACEQAAS